MKSLKTSLLQRSPKLLSATVKMLAGKDLDNVLNNLSELKGVPQKLGQLLSMDVTQYVPEELKDKLKPLQGEGKALDSAVILSLLKKELKDKFYEVKNFEEKALGAGSIGQVHKAEIPGAVVVFKIQYPDMAKSIESDMALLSPISSIYEFIRPKSKDLSILLKETKAMLLTELDYEKEKSHLIFFKEKLKHDARYIVPDVREDFSCQTIICMDYHNGCPLNDFIKNETSAKLKLSIAHNLLDLFIEEFLEWGKVQTDPNFANYLVDDKGTIVLLDFGAVKNFSPSFRKLYLSLLQAAYEGNEEKILHYGEELGLVHKSDSPEALTLFTDFLKDALTYFRPENNPLNFKNEDITKRLLETGWKLFKVQKISTPHSDMVFLHRKLGGLFSLLKEMELQIDLSPFWNKIEQKKGHL